MFERNIEIAIHMRDLKKKRPSKESKNPVSEKRQLSGLLWQPEKSEGRFSCLIRRGVIRDK